MEEAKGKWVDELPKILWATRMTSRISIGVSPFSLVYGREVFIPSKIQEPALQSNITREDNNYLRKEDLLLAEGKRENTLIQIESQKVNSLKIIQ